MFGRSSRDPELQLQDAHRQERDARSYRDTRWSWVWFVVMIAVFVGWIGLTIVRGPHTPNPMLTPAPAVKR
jgi:uncharacterized membrane protein